MKRILVTGANKGIGLGIVRNLLKSYNDVFVILGSRNVERGVAAAKTLEAYNDRLFVLQLDVASDDSVKAAVETVREKKLEPLYGIVNNAGVGFQANLVEKVNINTFGMRRVCDAFIPLLDQNVGRVVNVTSAAGPSYVAKVSDDLKALLCDRNSSWEQLVNIYENFKQDDEKKAEKDTYSYYGLSKALANMYTLQLAKAYPNLRVNACTPGFIHTDMTESYATSVGKSPQEMGMKTTDDGAQSTLFLLFNENLKGNGNYYGSDCKRSPLDRYRDPGDPEYEGDD